MKTSLLWYKHPNASIYNYEEVTLLIRNSLLISATAPLGSIKCCYQTAWQKNSFILVVLTQTEGPVCFIWALHCFQHSFSHITKVSGCRRELNAASLKYHTPDTWHDIPPSHIILTLGRPVLTPVFPFFNAECQAKEQLVQFLKSLLGIELTTSQPQSGCSTKWIPECLIYNENHNVS